MSTEHVRTTTGIPNIKKLHDMWTAQSTGETVPADGTRLSW
jgi:hypothetical protein